MQLIYRINKAGTTVVVATHDQEMVDKMMQRVIELRDGRIVRDQASGRYRAGDDEAAGERGPSLFDELGMGLEGHAS
jgi:cell division transport system ATP-binding protein